MRFALRWLALVLAVFNSGCLLPVTSQRADTVVAVRHSELDAVPMGFRRMDYRQYDDCLVIQGSGHFPREHETWVFWHLVGTTAHPYPDNSRRIRVVCYDRKAPLGPQNCRIQMLLQKGWPQRAHEQEYDAYEGEASLLFMFDSATVSAEFTDLMLFCPINPDDIIYVTGRIVGQRSNERDDSLSSNASNFTEDWAKATRITTQPIPSHPTKPKPDSERN